MNTFLEHTRIKVKHQGDNVEHLTNAKFSRTLEKDMVENIIPKREKGKE